MMDYCIITKIAYQDGCMKSTPIGYTRNLNIRNYINEVYDLTLGAWVNENKSDLENSNMYIYEFFEETEFVYLARTISNIIDGLEHITNIEQL